MPPALRLSAAWMIGALALAGGWRWYTVRDAKRAALQIPPAPAFVNDPHHAVITALRARYPHEPPGAGEVSLAPMYLGDPLVEINDPSLRRFLPGTSFFLTHVLSGCIGDPVLISFRRGDDGDDVQFWLAGVPDGSARRFLAQLLGADAPTADDRRDLARALADLARPLYGGRVDLLAGLWSDHAGDDPRSWRHVDVSVDAKGRVDRIVISHPVHHFVDVDVEVAASTP